MKKKYRRYIIQSTVYLVLVIAAISAAIFGPNIIKAKAGNMIKPVLNEITSDIQKDGSNLDNCKAKIDELYGYADEDAIAEVTEVYQEETNYRQIKEWVRGDQSWNNGRILVGLCKYPLYKDSYSMITKVFDKTKKNKGSSNSTDPYKIIYNAAETHYQDKDYVDAAALYSLLGKYKDSRDKNVKCLKEVAN